MMVYDTMAHGFWTRPTRPTRRGVVLVYVTIMMIALLGFVSLGVDLARVQLAKTQLMRAADSAARAAVAQLPNGTAAVQNAAVQYGGYNLVDGTALVIDPVNDVVIGTWTVASRTFAVGGASPNAVQVTARRTASRGTGVKLWFAGTIGINTCDAKQQVIAMNTVPSAPYVGAFVGINSVSLGNGSHCDSTPVSGYGSLMSSGNVSVGTGAGVTGYAYLQSGATLTNNGTVNKGTKTMSPNPAFPTTEAAPGNAIQKGNYSTSEDSWVTLAAGTYVFGTLSVGEGAGLIFTGPSTIYIQTSMTIGNGAIVWSSESGHPPASVQFRLLNSAPFTIGSGSNVYAYVYGPSSTVIVKDGTMFTGWIVSQTLAVGNNVSLNLDQNVITNQGQPSGAGSGTATISMVK